MFAAWIAALIGAAAIAAAWRGADGAIPHLWPSALGLAALGALLVARSLSVSESGLFLTRHVLLSLTPLLGFVLGPSSAADDGWEPLLYAAFALAFALHAVVALLTVAPRVDDRRIAWLLAATLLTAQMMLVSYTALAIMPEADEPHYLILAQSIALDRDLDLSNNYSVERYGGFYPARLPDAHAIQSGPALLPIRDLGLPLVAALPYAAGGRLLVLKLIAILAAIVVAQLYLLLRDLRVSPRVAVSAVAIVALSQPFHTYATQIYPEILVTLGGLLAVRAMRRGTAMSLGSAAFAGLMIATLPWFTTRAWFFAAGLALTLGFLLTVPILRGGARLAAARRLGFAAIPGAALIGLLLLVNWQVFGLPIPGAGFFLVSDQQEVLSGEPLLGAGGLFFGRVFGLIGRAPIFLLIFIGLATVLRRPAEHRPELAALIVGWSMHFAFIASLEHWHSDWAPPSRNLVATIPFLALAVAAGLETLRAANWPRVLGVVLVAAACWSLTVTLLFSADPYMRYELPERLRGGEPAQLWRVAQDTVGMDVARLLPRTTTQTPSTTPLLLIWLGVGAGLALWGWRATTRMQGARTATER